MDYEPVYKKVISRLFEISYKHKLSHLGSCLNVIEQLVRIYTHIQDNDIVILSCGHAGLAQYCVLEYFYPEYNAEDLFLRDGIHPIKDGHKIYATTGSLGYGLPIAIGYAMADPNRKVHCIISDGECAEGAIWESMRYLSQYPLNNLSIYLSLNGFSAYNSLDITQLLEQLTQFTTFYTCWYSEEDKYSWLQGLAAHYHVMTEEEYNETKIC